MGQRARRGVPGWGLAVLMLCLAAAPSQAQQPTPAAKPAVAAKIAVKPAKPNPHKGVAAKPSQHPSHQLAAHTAKSKPTAHKLAALPKHPAPAPKTAAAAPPRPAAPSYTETTLRDGVTLGTAKIVVPTPIAVAARVETSPAASPVVVANPPSAPIKAAAAVNPPSAPITPDTAANPPLAPIKAASAAAFVTTFLDDAFRIARASNVSALQRRAQLGVLFAGNMDIADIAGYTTGEKLAAQPTDFQQKFRSILISYLVETYYPKIEAASDRSISVEITPAPALPDGTAVVWTTFTKTGWGSQSVKWHLAAAKDGSFKVMDTLTGGASLVEMERATFLSVMRNGGVPSLMAKLDARTRELASAAPN